MNIIEQGTESSNFDLTTVIKNKRDLFYSNPVTSINSAVQSAVNSGLNTANQSGTTTPNQNKNFKSVNLAKDLPLKLALSQVKRQLTNGLKSKSKGSCTKYSSFSITKPTPEEMSMQSNSKKKVVIKVSKPKEQDRALQTLLTPIR